MPRVAITTADFASLEREIAGLLKTDLDTVHRKIAFDLFSGVVKKTPVDTGRARASWRVAIGSINTSVASGGGGSSLGAGSKVIAGAKADKPIWITNSLPYIQALENGHSKQSPAGMVQVTVAEVKAGLTRLT